MRAQQGIGTCGSKPERSPPDVDDKSLYEILLKTACRDWPMWYIAVPGALFSALLYPLFLRTAGFNGTTSSELFLSLLASTTFGLSHGALDALLMFRLAGGAYAGTLLVGYL